MLGIILSLLLVRQQSLPLPAANEELSRINLTYNSIQTYLDWGTISYSYQVDGQENAGESKRFNTGLSRVGRLRLEFVDPASDGSREKRSVTWTATRGGYAIWSSWMPREVDRTSLPKALDLASGMSDVSDVALKMLIPWALAGPRPTAITDATIGVETVSGKACFRIDGKRSGDSAVTLWADMANQLIVKYRRSVATTLDGKQAAEIATVELHPRLNPTLSPDDLRFVEPRSARNAPTRKRHRRRRRR